MLYYLQTHPSIFIIVATFVIIIMIFTCFMKKSNQEYKIEQRDNTNNEIIELEELNNSRPDEPDNLPVPKPSKKLRNESRPHIYDKSGVQKFPAIPESPLQPSAPFAYVSGENQPGSSSTNRNPVVLYREPRDSNQENRISVSDLHKFGSYASFGEDFDSFDEFRKSSADVLRVTVNFDADNARYIVPVLDKI